MDGWMDGWMRTSPHALMVDTMERLQILSMSNKDQNEIEPNPKVYDTSLKQIGQTK